MHGKVLRATSERLISTLPASPYTRSVRLMVASHIRFLMVSGRIVTHVYKCSTGP